MGSNPTLSAIDLGVVMFLKSGGHVSLHSIRLGRLMYWPPWTVSRPWRPHVELTGDEHCNPSLLTVVPLLGAVIVFYGRRWRTEADGPCERCIAEQAADGYRYSGDGFWQRDLTYDPHHGWIAETD